METAPTLREQLVRYGNRTYFARADLVAVGECGCATIDRMQIMQLRSEHAFDVACLHVAGQPGSFLSGLGPDVLSVLYRGLPESPLGYGFVAIESRAKVVSDCRCQFPIPPLEPPPILGFVSATSSVGQLFVEMARRRLGQFLPPLFACFARRPALILGCLQTLFYPFLAGGAQGERAGARAELLAIMVAPAQRGGGIGTALLEASQKRL